MRVILKAKALRGYLLELTFDDGVCGTADLASLAGKGVFALWNDRRTFESFRIGPSGDLAWGGRIDLCPDALYLKVTGKKPEDLFPALRPERAQA